MKKVITLLALAILLTSQAAFTQVNYTANDVIAPYEGFYHPGINLGYYGPNWDDNQLADLSAGNETVDVPGVGIKSLRGSLPEGLGLTFTYDIWINKYNYNNAVGTTDNLLFLGFASDAHKDTVDYCSSNDIQTDMFANLYEPIWDNGENGTPVNDENYYALYVYEVVSRLKDHVKFWEIWNEPGFDFSGAKGFLEPGQPGNWWENNPDPCDYKLRAPIFNYIRTLRISYEVIKSIAPDDYVCVAGLGYDSFLDAILRNTDNPDDGKVSTEYPLGGGAYFDVVGFHAYPHIDGSLRYWDNNIQDFVYNRHSDEAADALEIRTNARQEVLARYGYDGVTYPKKEWIATEVNVPSTAFDQPWGSQEVQRNYVMKVNIKAMELDYTQLHLFLLADFKTEADANFEFDLMGLYESISDKVPYQQVTKESGIGLKTMSDALFGSRYDAVRTAEMNLGDNIGGGAYLHEDGTYTYTLWAKTQTDLSEEAFASYNFPASFGLTAMMRREWDHSATGLRLGEGPGNIQLTGAPIFLRRLQDDPDIFLDVTCDMGIEIQVTATTPEGGQIVTWAEPTAVTNCTGGVTIEQTQGITNGGFFPFGVSEIQYTITNACGDVKYCAFNVKVASTGGGIGDCNLFRWEMGFVGQFEGNKYFVSKVKKDFAGAQAQCAGHGGYIVSIDSPEENEFLRQQVNDLAMTGYNDIAQEGVLEWASGKDVIYTNVADCQGCSNSEAGDVAMFNHFNGEWYFVPSTSVEYFIMELPCAEVPPCICTAEYDPVCSPDGTEYSNSCFAECDGVFNYGSCVDTCALSDLTWLEEIIDQSDCNNLDLEISSFESNGSTYILIDVGTSLSPDGDYSVYNCDGTTVCTETGINTASCTDLFGMDFTNMTTLYYSAAEECPCVCDAEYDPVCGPDGTEYSNSCIAECEGVFDYGSCISACNLSELTWLAEFIETAGCDNLDLVISSVEVNGSTYIIVDDGSSIAVDGGYVVLDCEGTLICTEAGFGSPLCTNLFGADFTDSATTYWTAAEECVEPCILDEQGWYQELLADTTLCDPSCLTSIESFEFGDSAYVAFIGHLGPCPDFVTEIYNCQQVLICTEGSIAGLTECSTLFGNNFPANSEVIWSAEVCPMPCDIEDMDWIDNKIESITCDDCIEAVYSYVYNDSTFIVELPNEDECDDVPIVVYDCNGDIFCVEGGNQGSKACSDYFGEDFDPVLDTLWDSNIECPDCTLENQDWLEAKIDSIRCDDYALGSILSIEINGISYVMETQNGSIESYPFRELTIYDCEGNVFCKDTEIDPLACAGESVNLIEVLWSRNAECPSCELEDQSWVAELLSDDALCENCIASIESFSSGAFNYLVVFGDNINCSDAQTIVYRCDGSTFCTDGGIAGSLECNPFFNLGQDWDVEQVEVLWDAEMECLDNSVFNLGVTSLDLFPNPASQHVQLSFSANQNMNLEYSLVNIAGQIVLSGKYTASAGMNQINLDLDDMVSGMYFVRLLDVDAGGERSLKLVKN